MKIVYLVLVSLVLSLSPVHAVEPPHLSEELRNKAEEVLKVEVISVELQDYSRKDHVEIYVKARLKVLAVRRSRNGLKYKYQINFNYLHRYRVLEDRTPVPGPSISPVIEKGQILTVFLNRVDGMRNTYKPAALGRSFQF